MPSVETGVVGRRFAQSLLDRLIVGVPALVLLFAMMIAVIPHPSLWLLPAPVFLAVLLLGTVATEVWLPHRNGGRTPGMRLLGLRIVTEWGSAPTLGAYALRLLLLVVVDDFAFGLVGLVIMLVSPRRQRLGDIVARTLVIRSAAPGVDHSVDSLRQQTDAAHRQDALEK
jgi:uncharacterized RDD family membrane protein YckC